MENHVESSDRGVIELLQQRGQLSVSDLTAAMKVTATAVRQRLSRLMRQDLVRREAMHSETVKSRGRPTHRYALTEKGRRQTGSNFADLTIALWREIRSIKDPEVRGGLLARIAKNLSGLYRGPIQGENIHERMESISQLMVDRNVPFAVEQRFSAQHNATLPVLTAHACPYPELAEQDRGICAVEKMMFSELLGENVRLSECRLDGANCCRFETN
jgi:DeoR family transcriptional regulator, suf operon transcriptional repressor